MFSRTLMSLLVKLAVDSRGYDKGIADAEKKSSGLQKTLGGLAKKIAIVAGPAAFGAAILSATKLAARVETLRVVVGQLGESSDYTTGDLERFEGQIKAQGITTQSTLQSMAQMIQANVDLAHGSDLARIAQNNAVIANINSSEAFQRLVTVLQTGNVLMGRTMGLNLDFAGSQKKLAASLDITVDQLSQAEIMQSRLNEVKRAGVAIEGAYDAAMGTTGKTMLSLDRQLEEISLAVGQVFLPVLDKAVELLYEAAKAVNEVIESDKKLITKERELARAIIKSGGSYEDLVRQIRPVVHAQGRYVYTQDTLMDTFPDVTKAFEMMTEGYRVMSPEIFEAMDATIKYEERQARLNEIISASVEPWRAYLLSVKDTGEGLVDASGKLEELAEEAKAAQEKIDAFWDAMARGPGVVRRAISGIEKAEWAKLGAEGINTFMDSVDRALDLRQISMDEYIDFSQIAGVMGVAIRASVEDLNWWEVRDTLVKEFGYGAEAAYAEAQLITAPGFDAKLYVDTLMAENSINALLERYRFMDVYLRVHENGGAGAYIPPTPIPVTIPPKYREQRRRKQYGGSGIVPSGFLGDSYPLMLTSGERYHVTSPSQTRLEDSQMLRLLKDIAEKETLDEVRLATLIRDAVLEGAE